MTASDYFLEHVPSRSLLVFPPSGLIRLDCPIPAKCIRDAGLIRAGDQVLIEGVTFTEADPLLYLIREELYPHHHFKILISNPYNHET